MPGHVRASSVSSQTSRLHGFRLHDPRLHVHAAAFPSAVAPTGPAREACASSAVGGSVSHLEPGLATALTMQQPVSSKHQQT